MQLQWKFELLMPCIDLPLMFIPLSQSLSLEVRCLPFWGYPFKTKKKNLILILFLGKCLTQASLKEKI